jgi:hypothetical protein
MPASNGLRMKTNLNCSSLSLPIKMDENKNLEAMTRTTKSLGPKINYHL